METILATYIRQISQTLGKRLHRNLFFNKLQVPETLLKKILQRRCFPVNFRNFQERSFYRTLLGDCFWLELCSGILPSFAFRLVTSGGQQILFFYIHIYYLQFYLTAYAFTETLLLFVQSFIYKDIPNRIRIHCHPISQNIQYRIERGKTWMFLFFFWLRQLRFKCFIVQIFTLR